MPPPPCCFTCARVPGDDEAAFNRCGACKSRTYCSRKCQRADWIPHKLECKSVAERKILSTCARVFSLPEEDDWIFYVKAIKPQIQDIYLQGPFVLYSQIRESLRARLVAEGSSEGIAEFNKIVKEPGYGITQFNAPLPDGSAIMFKPQAEKNPKVAKALRRRLSGQEVSTYRVFYTIPDPEFAAREKEVSESAHTPVEDAGVVATFTTKKEANDRAREVLLMWKSGTGPATTLQTSTKKDDGLVEGTFIGDDGLPAKLVEVRHENGNMASDELDRPIRPPAASGRGISVKRLNIPGFPEGEGPIQYTLNGINIARS